MLHKKGGEKVGEKPGLVQSETCLFFSIQLERDESVSGVAPRPWLCPKGKCQGKKDIKQFTFITHCLIAGVRLAAGDMKLAGYKLLKSKIGFEKQMEMCHQTQFQIKGARSVQRRDIFDVLGTRYKSFFKTRSTRNFLCEGETYKQI